MKTQVTIDKEGKIQEVLYNGKPIKAGFMRGINKAQETHYWKLYETGEEVQNPFSGVKVALDCFELSLYQWLMNWYRISDGGMNTDLAGAPTQAYDDVKYLILEINPDAYWNLID